MALVPCQVLRVAILLSYFSILCNYKAIDMPAHQTYGGSWKFLTFINLVSLPTSPGASFLRSPCTACAQPSSCLFLRRVHLGNWLRSSTTRCSLLAIPQARLGPRGSSSSPRRSPVDCLFWLSFLHRPLAIPERGDLDKGANVLFMQGAAQHGARLARGGGAMKENFIRIQHCGIRNRNRPL